MLPTIALIALAFVPIGKESLVAGHSAVLIAAAVCAVIPLILWRFVRPERIAILVLIGGLIGAVVVQFWRVGPLLQHLAGLGAKIQLLTVSVVESVLVGGFGVMIVYSVLANIMLIRRYLWRRWSGNRV
jgi:hypothetical protein